VIQACLFGSFFLMDRHQGQARRLGYWAKRRQVTPIRTVIVQQRPGERGVLISRKVESFSQNFPKEVSRPLVDFIKM
jgi:hypothetical protein